MLRSLYSGVSGMKNLQNELDVVANNIANVNTIGFKSSRVVFQDIVSQNLQGASAPANGRGGSNALQVGLGVSTAAIDTNTGAGATQVTGNASDLAIQGSGYFAVNRGGQTEYTQNGDFALDANGNLVASDGSEVQGVNNYAPGSNVITDGASNPTALSNSKGVNGLQGLQIPQTISGFGTNSPAGLPTPAGTGTYQPGSFQIGQTGVVTANYTFGSGNTAVTQSVVVGKIAIANFTNPNGLQKVGNTSFVPSPNSGQPQISDAGTQGAGTLQAGALEMSNVDLSTEFTNMIVASRAYEANAKSITTSDEILQTLINLKQG